MRKRLNLGGKEVCHWRWRVVELGGWRRSREPEGSLEEDEKVIGTRRKGGCLWRWRVLELGGWRCLREPEASLEVVSC